MDRILPQRRSFLLTLLGMPFALAGCTIKAPPSATRIIPTLIPTHIVPTIPPTTTSTDTGWLRSADGIELRHMRLPLTNGSSAPIVIARLQPASIRIRIGYQPEKPQSLRRWFENEQPLLAINAGYFTAEQQSTALVISDGITTGSSYSGFGGMLAVHGDGVIELRPLRDTPYDPTEDLQQATQSAPMLVFPGGVAADLNDNGERARRSIVAFDTNGNLLCIVGPTSATTLSELANWLPTSDLAIERALNLDGGSSTGLFFQSGSLHETIDSFTKLPIVILIYKNSA